VAVRIATIKGIENILNENDLTAVKIHFGEQGNTA